jgi:hypothetical protein
LFIVSLTLFHPPPGYALQTDVRWHVASGHTEDSPIRQWWSWSHRSELFRRSPN